jgi:hypothetical protein
MNREKLINHSYFQDLVLVRTDSDAAAAFLVTAFSFEHVAIGT